MNKLIPIILVSLIAIITSISGMEEPLKSLDMKVLNKSRAEITLRAQDNTLLATIKEGQLKTFDTFSFQWDTVEIVMKSKDIFLYDRLVLYVYADNEYYATIEIDINKKPERSFEVSIFEPERWGETPRRYYFGLLDTPEAYLPITIFSNLEIGVGPQEEIEKYHMLQLSRLESPSKVIIKGQEFQIPQELIKARAPQLKYLSE
jgi:hypothetical protein